MLVSSGVDHDRPVAANLLDPVHLDHMKPAPRLTRPARWQTIAGMPQRATFPFGPAWSALARFTLALAASAALAPPLEAQSPGSLAGVNQTTLAEEFTAAPQPGQSGVSATIGLQVQDGRTETVGLSVDGIFAHTTQRKQLLRVDVAAKYGRYRPGPGEPLFVAENNQLVSFTYLQRIKERFGAFGMAGWRRDTILQLDYRAWVEGGYGVEAVARENVLMFIGGSVSIGSEERQYTETGSAVLDVGVLQTFTLRPTPVMLIEENLKAHFDTLEPDDKNATFNASVMARVAKHVGLKIYYKYQYDSLHPPTTGASQSEFGAGVQIDFKPGSGTTR